MLDRLGETNRGPFSRILNQVWQEFALPVARVLNAQDDLGRCMLEALCVWENMVPYLQREFLSFVGFQYFEHRQNEGIAQQLDTFAHAFFQKEHEEELVLPSCPGMGYMCLHNLGAPRLGYSDLEMGRVTDASGCLELLQPCAERPSSTKYDAFSIPDVHFDRCRRALL